MKIQFSDITSLIRSLFRHKISFLLETAILTGIYAIGILFLILLFLDIYLFYITALKRDQKAASPPLFILVSEKVIVKGIGMLDKRKQEFKKILAIHHIDYNKKNNKEENLITLCRSCNVKVNFNRKSRLL